MPCIYVGQQSRKTSECQLMAAASLQLMDLTSLRAVLWDLRRQLIPSRFEKAQQPDAARLQLGFRSLSGMTWIELSWLAEAPHLIQIPPPARQGDGSTLAQQLQHSLRQLALVEVRQPGFERVVEFRLAARPGERVQRVLVLELMGRHSNLLLLDDQRQVITLGRQVRDHQSRVRPIGTGDGYVPPPPLQGLPPDPQESKERWRERLQLLPIPLRKALQQSYQGISPPLIQQLTGSLADSSVQDLEPDQWAQLHRSWQGWLQALEQESFGLQLQDEGRYQVWSTDKISGEPGLALALGRWYREQLDQRALSRRTHEVLQRLARWRGKEEQALTDQMQRQAATAGSDDLQQQADALLCLPSPSREQVEQAQKLYRRARKLRRSVAVLEERLNHHQRRLDLINGSEAFIEDLQIAHWQPVAPRLTALQELHSELEELLNPGGRQQERRQQRQSTPQPLELVSPGGLLLQVGRNHLQNDWISLRQARSGDLWFHAQECPGSHVVLKASSGLPEEDDLMLATDLAAYFSRARGNSRVAVVMVPTTQLQRIPGAGPGTVRHRGGEIRWGEPQRAEQHLHASAASSLASTGV